MFSGPILSELVRLSSDLKEFNKIFSCYLCTMHDMQLRDKQASIGSDAVEKKDGRQSVLWYRRDFNPSSGQRHNRKNINQRLTNVLRIENKSIYTEMGNGLNELDLWSEGNFNSIIIGKIIQDHKSMWNMVGKFLICYMFLLCPSGHCQALWDKVFNRSVAKGSFIV